MQKITPHYVSVISPLTVYDCNVQVPKEENNEATVFQMALS